MLEGIKEFKVRYLATGKDWANSWESKDTYPDAVEISLTVERGEKEKKKKISMQIVATVRFPNNKAAN